MSSIFSLVVFSVLHGFFVVYYMSVFCLSVFRACFYALVCLFMGLVEKSE